MKVCVLGLWHLGTVMAAGLAEAGHEVTGLDFDAGRIAPLRRGESPVFEPGLDALIGRGLASGRLRFEAHTDAVSDVEALWVAYDTPVDDDDHADTDFVMAQIARALPVLKADTLLLNSSQLPVGSMRCLEGIPGMPTRRMACCPENLRLGRAVEDFLHPARIVAGVRCAEDRQQLTTLLQPLTDSIEWMSVESAEMTKHALNAFLAVSVVFANEMAALCEAVGADAKDVERGMRTDARVGPRAYVSPGAAFAGGTLARDVGFLNGIAEQRAVNTPMLSAVLPSNTNHKGWARRALEGLFADLRGVTVVVWGLAYKSGTDTLRRSMSVELCDWMIGAGMSVRVHDPLVRTWPERWSGIVTVFADPLEALKGAEALVIAVDNPAYRAIAAAQLTQLADGLAVLDPNRVVPALAQLSRPGRYLSVGTSSAREA